MMEQANVQAEKRSSRLKMALIATSCAALLAVGGVFAYLTDTDTATNKFTVAEALDIDVTEPGWDALPDADGDGVPDEVENMVPTQRVAKDPVVKNLAGTEAYMIAQVKIPVASVTLSGADTATKEELFDLINASGNVGVNSGWTQQGGVVYVDANGSTVSGIGSAAYAVYTYIADAPVAIGKQTPALFNQIQLINFSAHSLSGAALTQTVEVIGYGIQTEGFDNGAAAWAAYQNQND